MHWCMPATEHSAGLEELWCAVLMQVHLRRRPAAARGRPVANTSVRRARNLHDPCINTSQSLTMAVRRATGHRANSA